MKKFLEIIKFLIERFSANNKVTMDKCAKCVEHEKHIEKELKETEKVAPVTQNVQKKRRGRPRKQRG